MSKISINTLKEFMMIRGVNKYIIEVTNTENKYFDKAILFLNPDYSQVSQGKIEIEAKKYIKTVADAKKPTGYLRKRIKKRRVAAAATVFAIMVFIILSLMIFVK